MKKNEKKFAARRGRKRIFGREKPELKDTVFRRSYHSYLRTFLTVSLKQRYGRLKFAQVLRESACFVNLSVRDVRDSASQTFVPRESAFVVKVRASLC